MKKIHKSWYVCIWCTIILIVTNGFCCNVFPVYLPYIEMQGYTGVQASALLSIRCLFSIISMLFVTRYYKRFTLRRGIIYACFMMTGAYIIYILADNYLMFQIASALSGLSYGFGSMIPISILIKNWFYSRQGMALGICASGTGISTFLFPPLITLLVERYNIEAAFGVQVGVALFVTIGTIIFIRDTPEEKKVMAYGIEERGKEENSIKNKFYGYSIQNTICMLIAIFLLGGVALAATGHYSALFSSMGYSMHFVSIGISFFGLILIATKLIYGSLVDRFGGLKSSITVLTVLFLGLVLCCLADGKSMLIMYGAFLLMGIGFPPATVGLSTWALEFSDKKTYQMLLKWYNLLYVVGGMVFSYIPGYIYMKTGNYKASFWIFAGMIVAVMACVGLAYFFARSKKTFHH